MHSLLLLPLKSFFPFKTKAIEKLFTFDFSHCSEIDFGIPHHLKHQSDIILLQTHSNLKKRNFYTNQTSVSIVCQTISYVIFLRSTARFLFLISDVKIKQLFKENKYVLYLLCKLYCVLIRLKYMKRKISVS